MAYHEEYYKKNKAKINERSREYYSVNKEVIRERHKMISVRVPKDIRRWWDTIPKKEKGAVAERALRAEMETMEPTKTTRAHVRRAADGSVDGVFEI